MGSKNGAGEVLERGAVMAEAALTMGVFFLILIGFLELLIFVYSAAVVQFSLDRAVRTVAVKQTAGVADIKAFVSGVAQRIGVGVNLSPGNISVCETFNASCAGNESRGRSDEYFTVSVQFTMNGIIFPYRVPMSRRVFVKNEPFL